MLQPLHIHTLDIALQVLLLLTYNRLKFSKVIIHCKSVNEVVRINSFILFNQTLIINPIKAICFSWLQICQMTKLQGLRFWDWIFHFAMIAFSILLIIDFQYYGTWNFQIFNVSIAWFQSNLCNIAYSYDVCLQCYCAGVIVSACVCNHSMSEYDMCLCMFCHIAWHFKVLLITAIFNPCNIKQWNPILQLPKFKVCTPEKFNDCDACSDICLH
jgi:hypothetical protein